MLAIVALVQGTAIVHPQFGTENILHLMVSLMEEMGAWKIYGIEQAK